MKKFFLLISLAVLCCVQGTQAQIDLNQPLPMDTTIVVGKLSNGITYYLRHNTEPRQRASFYLIRNAGSLLEEDNQDGLAHFLEHMAFQGTKHFPGNGIVAGLGKHGVSFGTNINAFTGQNETVYNLSAVPTVNESLVDTCLLILHDWSHYLTLEEKEIDAERNVIAEEWRTRRTPAFRIQKQTLPYTFKGSRYAERDVIGSLDVIKNFRPQELRDFYTKWYRTDLEAIVIVGDLDMKVMEEKIKKLFSPLPAVKNPALRPFFTIPDHEQTEYVLATDKEASHSSLGLAIRHRDTTDNTKVGFLKENLIVSLYNSMINNRIRENQMRQTDPVFLNGSISLNPLVRGYNVYNLSVGAKPNEEAVAWEAILRENERLRRYGFTAGELARVKKEMLTGLENSYRQRGKAKSENYVHDIREHFLTGKPVITFDAYYQLTKQLIPAITLEEVSAKAKLWTSAKNRCIIVTGPSDGVCHLTRQEAMDILYKVENATDIKPYVEKQHTPGEQFFTEELKGGKVVAVKSLPQFSATEWTLDNGARVVFRKAAYDKRSVMISSHSPGGTSMVDVDLLPAAENAAVMVSSFGLGDHDPATLRKLLSGKRANSRVSISTYSESVGGSASPQDLELLFQQIYLRFEKPRFDKELFASTMKRNRAGLAQRIGRPQAIMQDSLQLIMDDYHPRSLLFNEEYLNGITLERLEQVYQDRIKDASDFVFFIVGNVEEERVRSLVEKYIGSLPSEYRKEQWRNHCMGVPRGRTVKEISVAMQTPKATVVTGFFNELKYSSYNNVCGTVLQALLQTRYINSIREQKGGTYNITVSAASNRIPNSVYSMQMQFDCDPIKVAELKPLIYAEVEQLMKEGPTPEELSKVLKAMKQNNARSRNSNGYWMSAIATYYMDGIDMTDPANFDGILDTLTAKDMQKFAKKLFKKADVVDLVFKPKAN